jgi:hypothetical protein
MAKRKRKAGPYAKCVGRYLKRHRNDGTPSENMKAAAAECKGPRKRYYPKGRRRGVRR